MDLWINQELGSFSFRSWFYGSWIYPRDLKFIEKAGKVLDLHTKQWEGELLQPIDYVVCAAEKTSTTAGVRKHPTDPPCLGKLMSVKHEYTFGGVWPTLLLRVFTERKSLVTVKLKAELNH